MNGAQRRSISRHTIAIMLVAIVQLALHFVWSTGYGLSGDELYAIACSTTPAAGYVDLAPLPVLLLGLQRAIGGDALFTIRLVSAVVSSISVILTGFTARRMGAGPFGQFLAALCVSIAPAFLFAGHVATSFSFALLTWAAGVYIIIRLLQEPKPLLWILLGIVSGAGLLSSFSVAFFIVAAVIAIILSPLRKQLLTAWPWTGAAVTIAMMIPWIIWQAGHAWPTFDWLAIAYQGAEAGSSILSNFLELVKLLHPLSMPVWLSGLGVLLFAAPFRAWKMCAWMFLAALILMIAAGMEPHYMAPAAIALFAAGAIAVEKVLIRSWMRVSAIAALVIAGAAALPMGLPVLEPRTFIAYEKLSGFRMTMGDTGCTDRLPGYYGTMFGRKELAVVVNAVFSTMAPEERGQYGILCETAVQAASLDFFRREYGYPAVVSGDRQYWFRGPGTYTGDRMIVVGGDERGLRSMFGEVQLRMRFRDEYLHPGNRMTPIWIVGKPLMPLETRWNQLWTVK